MSPIINNPGESGEARGPRHRRYNFRQNSRLLNNKVNAKTPTQSGVGIWRRPANLRRHPNEVSNSRSEFVSPSFTEPEIWALDFIKYHFDELIHIVNKHYNCDYRITHALISRQQSPGLGHLDPRLIVEVGARDIAEIQFALTLLGQMIQTNFFNQRNLSVEYTVSDLEDLIDVVYDGDESTGDLDEFHQYNTVRTTEVLKQIQVARTERDKEDNSLMDETYPYRLIFLTYIPE